MVADKSHVKHKDTSGKGKLASTALALTLSALCLQSIDSLSTRTQILTESKQAVRNRAASSLYAKLATLPQPYKRSDITRTVHQFISQDSVADGATVFDTQGLLVAQLGKGNDRLLEQPFGQSIARIPIKSSDAHAGHVLLRFQSVRSLSESVFHYAALASALVLLCMLAVWLLSHGTRALFSVLRQPVDSP